jgi:hypothetical protein
MIDSVIIGFGYRARSGKDSAVAEIIKQRGLLKPGEIGNGAERYDIRRYAFADKLKQEVTQDMRMFGGPKGVIEKYRQEYLMPDWVQLESNPDMTDALCPFGKFRKLLQWYGSEFRRDHNGPDYWVRQLANTIELEKPAIACITDMRFENEMEFVLQYGEAVRVDRDSLPPATHISETALEDSTDWSLILENNGTLEEFLEGAVATFDELMISFPFGHNKM